MTEVAGGHSPVVPVRLPCGGRRRRLSLGTGRLGLLTACRASAELDDRVRLNNWSIAASYDTARDFAGLGFGSSTASRSIISRPRRPLINLAMRHTAARGFRKGALIGYGANTNDAFRALGVFVGRLLKGERAADLPVQRSVKIDLLINLKTAKMLGIEVPPALLARADEVIE